MEGEMCSSLSPKVLTSHLGVCSKHYRAFQMLVIGLSPIPKQKAKKFDGFLAAICSKYGVKGEI